MTFTEIFAIMKMVIDMRRLDFCNRNYSLDEIIDVYTDGSLDNFKGDEDFLNFLISYSLGEQLVGDEEDSYREWAKYDGIFNIMKLDELNLFGRKLYQIYEICGKDKYLFMKTCDLIGRGDSFENISSEVININLKLKEPVNFFDNDIILGDGTRVDYNLEEFFWGRVDRKGKHLKEFMHEQERSLRRRINESIKKNGDDIPLLEEFVSYSEKLRMEEEREEAERKAKEVKDEYEIDINNLFFGSYEHGSGGGVVNFSFKVVSWFENININMFGYHVFRSVPIGDYCLLDDNGQIYIPDTNKKKDAINVGPNQSIRCVNIANVPTILRSAIEKLKEDPVSNESLILDLQSFLELLESDKKITVGKAKEYEGVVRAAYEIAYGEIFKYDDNVHYEAEEYIGGRGDDEYTPEDEHGRRRR